MRKNYCRRQMRTSENGIRLSAFGNTNLQRLFLMESIPHPVHPQILKILMLIIFGFRHETRRSEDVSLFVMELRGYGVMELWSYGVMERSLFVSATADRYSFIPAVDKPELIKRYSAFTEATHCLSPHPSVKSRNPCSSVIQTIFGFREGWNSPPILFILKS